MSRLPAAIAVVIMAVASVVVDASSPFLLAPLGGPMVFENNPAFLIPCGGGFLLGLRDYGGFDKTGVLMILANGTVAWSVDLDFKVKSVYVDEVNGSQAIVAIGVGGFSNTPRAAVVGCDGRLISTLDLDNIVDVFSGDLLSSVYKVAYHPCWDSLVLHANANNEDIIIVADAVSGSVENSIKVSDSPLLPASAPRLWNDTYVEVTDKGKIIVADLAAGRASLVAIPVQGDNYRGYPAPRPPLVAVVVSQSGGFRLVLVNVESGEYRIVSFDELGVDEITQVAWSPEGYLAVRGKVEDDVTVDRIVILSPDARIVWNGSFRDFLRMAWQPGGSLLAVGQAGNITIVDAGSGSIVSVIDTVGRVRGFSWTSNTSLWVVSKLGDTTLAEHYEVIPEGYETVELTILPQSPVLPWIVEANGTLAVLTANVVLDVIYDYTLITYTRIQAYEVKAGDTTVYAAPVAGAQRSNYTLQAQSTNAAAEAALNILPAILYSPSQPPKPITIGILIEANITLAIQEEGEYNVTLTLPDTGKPLIIHAETPDCAAITTLGGTVTITVNATNCTGPGQLKARLLAVYPARLTPEGAENLTQPKLEVTETTQEETTTTVTPQEAAHETTTMEATKTATTTSQTTTMSSETKTKSITTSQTETSGPQEETTTTRELDSNGALLAAAVIIVIIVAIAALIVFRR